jgi:phosphate-selective porin
VNVNLPSLVLTILLVAGTATAQESSGSAFKWRDHPQIDLGAVQLELKARVEADVHSATPAAGRDHADWVWPRPRVEIAGEIGRRVAFEVSRELGSAGREDVDWKDAFVNLRLSRRVEIKGGRFKIPFGREALVARANLDFINRAIGSTQLAPSRDSGIMVHGRALGSRLRYEAGYFDRDGDNARTDHAAGARHTLAGRAVVRPFAGGSKRPASSLHFGVAVARSLLDDRLGLRGRTLLQDGVFFDRFYVNGRRQRTGVEGSWSVGPASIGGEYITVSDQRRGMGFDLEDLPSVDARAWYVAATWAITGEKKDGRLEPEKKTGGIEIVGRVEELRFADVRHPGAAFGFPVASALPGNSDLIRTVGVNWSITRLFRIQYNIAFERISDAQRSPAPTNGGRVTTGLLRLQFTM